MVTKILGKINGRLKFLFRKKSFLNGSLRRMLCNSLIQPHFDYACSAWYPNLNKKYMKKVQIAQNKCIRFCLFLENRAHIGVKEFRKINWIPTRERFEQCVSVGVYKFCKSISQSYMGTFLSKTTVGIIHENPLRCWIYPWKIQQSFSYLGQKCWNILP